MTEVTTPRGPSLTDVATLAGVSHQTVSRVVNRHPNVSEATRRKVRAAISELDYRPNAAARWLATGRTHSIGILAGELAQYGPSSVLMGIQDAARGAGYFLTVVTLKDYSERAVNEALTDLLNHGVEGVIAITPHVSALEVLAEVQGSTPMVTVGGGHGLGRDVALDQEGGAIAAVEHLVELGHTRIAHLAGPLDWVDAQRRLDGWRSALGKHHLGEGPVYQGDWSARSGYEAGRAVDLDDGPTAVFASNDQMALGLVKALRERGCRIPRDISVIGFDDVPEAEFYEPSLTTVRQEFQDLGRSCIEALIDRSGELAVEGDSFRPRLVVRSSTAPAAGHRP
jgi:DNA-binding LacI/PurR family transcriptional regulator